MSIGKKKSVDMKHVKMILFFVLTCLALSSCGALVGGVVGNAYQNAYEQQRGTQQAGPEKF